MNVQTIEIEGGWGLRSRCMNMRHLKSIRLCKRFNGEHCNNVWLGKYYGVENITSKRTFDIGISHTPKMQWLLLNMYIDKYMQYKYSPLQLNWLSLFHSMDPYCWNVKWFAQIRKYWTKVFSWDAGKGA